MQSKFRSTRPAAALLALSLLASGCGGKAAVRGKVTDNGQPITVSDKGSIQIILVSEANKSEFYPATTQRDGSFEVPGGVPAGKYRISVQQLDPYSPPNDKLQGKFAPGKTPIVRDVTGAAIDIDLAKP